MSKTTCITYCCLNVCGFTDCSNQLSSPFDEVPVNDYVWMDFIDSRLESDCFYHVPFKKNHKDEKNGQYHRYIPYPPPLIWRFLRVMQVCCGHIGTPAWKYRLSTDYISLNSQLWSWWYPFSLTRGFSTKDVCVGFCKWGRLSPWLPFLFYDCRPYFPVNTHFLPRCIILHFPLLFSLHCLV